MTKREKHGRRRFLRRIVSEFQGIVDNGGAVPLDRQYLSGLIILDGERLAARKELSTSNRINFS